MAKIAFLFPGQGAQTVGMAKQLVETIPAARQLFDEAADVLGYNLADLCFHGPAERLNSTLHSQPAIFVASLAALESLRISDPSAVAGCAGAAGLSLGEYTALVFAGVMSFRAGLALVDQRARAMQAAADAVPSGMVSVLGLERDKVEELCVRSRGTGTLEIANFLCPGNIVVSGTQAGCAAAEKVAEEMGARTVRLAVAGAFHTVLMKPADDVLAGALVGVTLQKGRLPVWSNVDAQPRDEPNDVRPLLVRQVLEPVQWEQTTRNLLAAGFDKFYEIGPGRVLAGLLKRVQRKVDCQNVSA